MRMPGVRKTSYRRAGRLVPRGARGLRARAVALGRGGMMAWHSTRLREELLIALTGTMHVEIEPPAKGRTRSLILKAGDCVFLPRATVHRVVNRSPGAARYLYVTAPATGVA